MQGFYFALLQYSPIQAFTVCFMLSMQFTAHAAKQRTGLYRCFPCDLPHSTAADTRPAQAAIMLPAPRWTLYRAAQRPIIIMYIRVAVPPVIDPCQPGGVSSYRLRIAGKRCALRTC
nr:MAG TPA: hypothetical protein [Caudoviricetes sp.]